MVSSTPRPHFTPGKDPVPILQEAGWAPGLVWTGGKSRPYRDSIPDRPARSQSLYRLSYPAHKYYNIINLWDHRRICSPSLTETSLCSAYLYKYTPRKLVSWPILPSMLSRVHGITFPMNMQLMWALQRTKLAYSQQYRALRRRAKFSAMHRVQVKRKCNKESYR